MKSSSLELLGQDTNDSVRPPAGAPTLADGRTCERSIAELVAEVYEAAPADGRGQLLEQLMRPLGVLSLCGIAGGLFASIRLRSGWQDFRIRFDDIQRVSAEQVIALVDHVQQVSVESVDALAHLIASSPTMAGSAAAALLVPLLVQRARARRPGGATSRSD